MRKRKKPVSERQEAPLPSFEEEARLVERLRGLCLALPETTESSAWNHPNFRAGSRTFATFERIEGRPSFAFRLPKDEIERLLLEGGFFWTPYGRGQWVSLGLERPPDWKRVERLVESAYRGVALKHMLRELDASRTG